MKHLFAFLCFCFASTATQAQCAFENPGKSLGIGIITFDKVDGMYVELYNDSTLKSRYVFWDVYNKEPEKPICSLFYKPDYGIVHIVYLRKLKHCFEVLINGNQKKYVPNHKKVIAQTWGEYLKGLNSISFIPDTTTKYIYTEPDIKSDVVADDEAAEKSYCVIEVKGDWIKVRLDCNEDPTPCNQMECNSSAIGWIRWRKDNKLLIQCSFLC